MIDVAERILRMYGFMDFVVSEPQSGYRNQSFRVDVDGSIFNLMVFKGDGDTVKRINDVDAFSGYLADHGLPIRQRVRSELVRVRSDRSERFAGLYTYLPGETISWDAYTKEHIKELGSMLGQLHEASRSYDAAQLPEIESQLASLNARMIDYFTDSGVASALSRELQLRFMPEGLPAFTKIFDTTRRSAVRHALHMDFVRSNILFDDKKLCGVIDFEKAAVGHPMYDVARTLAFLLVDCKYKEAAKVYRYFVYSGYVKRGGQKLANPTIGSRKLLEQLTDFFLIHDFYKFLKHNPYASLGFNEHFIRTRDNLLSRGFLEYD